MRTPKEIDRAIRLVDWFGYGAPNVAFPADFTLQLLEWTKGTDNAAGEVLDRIETLWEELTVEGRKRRAQRPGPPPRDVLAT